MKKIYILSLVIFFSFNIVNAQESVISKTKERIAAGDSKGLSQYFASQVDISLNGDKSAYSKSQGEMVIRNFFRKNQPKSFAYIHQGSSRGAMKYVVGRLKTTANISFRMQILFKESSGGYVIESLQINEE